MTTYINATLIVAGLLKASPQGQAALTKYRLLGGRVCVCGSCGGVMLLGPDAIPQARAGDTVEVVCNECHYAQPLDTLQTL